MSFIAIGLLFVSLLINRSSSVDNEEKLANSWVEYCATDEKACFWYPELWTLGSVDNPYALSADASTITVSSPTGTVVSFYSQSREMEPSCDLTDDSAIVFDTVQASGFANNIYLVQMHANADPTTVSIGYAVLGTKPATGVKTNFCELRFAFPGKNSPGVVFFGANEIINPDDIETVNKILSSYKYY